MKVAYLKTKYQWSNTDFAWILTRFASPTPSARRSPDGSSIGWARGEVSAWRPLIAMAAMLLIVRNSDETQRWMLSRI